MTYPNHNSNHSRLCRILITLTVKGRICFSTVEAESNIIESIRRNKVAFGIVVEKRRVAAGHEQRVFSRMAKIGNSHLRQIEQGEVAPTLTTITKIALALGTDIDDLIVETCCVAKTLDPPPSR